MVIIDKIDLKFDRTFCKAKICVDENCKLRLTEEIEREAKKINYPLTYIIECGLPMIVKSQKKYIRELEEQLLNYRKQG